MHVRDLVELGALVAAHGTSLVQYSSLLTKRHTEQYWLASRCRHDRWFQALKTYERATPQSKEDHWPFVQAVVEEILASELLTRTWAAVGCSYDDQHDSCDFEGVVRSIYQGHLEARNRVLHLMVRGEGFSIEEGVRLNRLRRQTERWTDMMLGYLAGAHDVDEFAFNPELVQDFSADLAAEKRPSTDQHAWKLTLASLRAVYQDNLDADSPHGELNQRIAGSILACLHSDLFDSIGTLKSHWVLRLNRITEETQGLVEDLLKVDDALSNRFSVRR